MGWASMGLSAQMVEGRISDEASRQPLAFADVRLLTVDERVAAVGVSDSAGRYRIGAPEPGSYRVQVDLIGYARLLSPLLALRTGRTVTADFELPADPIELEGLRVEADALERIRDDLRMYGVRLADLGERFVDRAAIERRWAARDFGQVLQWQSVPGMTVTRSDDFGTGRKPSVCVRLVADRARCALVILNGARVGLETAALVPPESLRAMAVLQPAEATLIYGTLGGGGAVLLFTR